MTTGSGAGGANGAPGSRIPSTLLSCQPPSTRQARKDCATVSRAPLRCCSTAATDLPVSWASSAVLSTWPAAAASARPCRRRLAAVRGSAGGVVRGLAGIGRWRNVPSGVRSCPPPRHCSDHRYAGSGVPVGPVLAVFADLGSCDSCTESGPILSKPGSTPCPPWPVSWGVCQFGSPCLSSC